MSNTDTEGFAIEPVPTPAYRLPYNAAALEAAHAEANPCPHRRTYVVAGRKYCHACGRKVGQEMEDRQ